MQGTYTCLSYCWGDSQAQTGRTTHHNLSSQLRGIPFRDLPSTVIDAIRLCYKLGFRFLWVDRLCIVQDDIQDWSEEASRMCEIYSRSALTISVPLCKESSQSFLAERGKGFREQSQFAAITHKEEFEFKCNSWFYSGSSFPNKGPWFLENSWENFRKNLDHSERPWLRRGWTFQEWMLSPRVLHIDSMTLWDCFDGYANEFNRRYMGEARLLRNPKEFGRGISWDFLVEEYSKRRTTREEDKLPALAGLAARYAQVTERTYLAGLWQEDLPSSLLWEPREHQETANRCAPSWSWASFNGRVSNVVDPRPFTARASISSFFCQYSPPGSFTAVEKAWIDVDGLVGAVTKQFGTIPWTDGSKVDELKTGFVIVGDDWWRARPDHGDIFPDDAIEQDSVCSLLLGSSPGTVKDGYSRYYGLVLQECGWEGDRQCYRRLGVSILREDEKELRPRDFGTSWEARRVRLV